MKYLLITLSIFYLGFTSYAQSGVITGTVTDSKTGESLMGANIVIVENLSYGSSSDVNGKFKISLPVGSYSVRVSLIGYQTIVKTDVIVTTGSEFQLNLKLAQTQIELKQVTVTADYFDKGVIENNLSTVLLGAEEIKRSPGSVQDFQRILQGMAGVSFSNDQNNELLVRGGSPDENLTVYDHMEVHSTNHYPNQFNSGGPINMVNVDLIDDIQFSTGGFTSKYGDKLSSVMNITTREGTREKLFSMNTNFSMAGIGTVMEGGIGPKGSWIFSARKSYIDLIAGAVGLTAVPKYYDLQFKAAYDLSKQHKLSFSGIYGNDKIDIEGEPEKTNLLLAGSRDSVDIYNINVRNSQYTAGFTLRSIWSDKFNSFLTISRNSYFGKVDVSSDFTERYYNNAGKIDNTNILTSRKIYGANSDNGETAVKTEFTWNNTKTNELSFGGAVKFIHFRDDEQIDADTVRYDLNSDGIFDTLVTMQANNLHYDFNFPNYYKGYGYINDKLTLLDEKLILNLGLRYDYFSYSRKATLAPRISGSYSIFKNLADINFSYGKYYQTPALPYYGDRYHKDINRFLESIEADHYILGFDYILDDGLKLNVEGYYKKYSGIPVDEEFVNFYDRTSREDRNLNIGKQKVYGIDILLQQKLVKDIYGTIAFSRMWTSYSDPRKGKEGQTFTSEYDFPYVFTAIAGKRFSGLRSEINKMPFYIKYPSYILPFSDDMEISVRWRYANGKPYTAQKFVTNEQHRQGAVKWTEGTWVYEDDINTERYPDYHRLDIGFSSRYNFTNWNLVVFLSVQNIYNRQNIAFYQYNSDGSRENVYQFSMLPVLGIQAEF